MATVADRPAPTDDATLYTCNVCHGGPFALVEMEKSRRRGVWRVTTRCLRCANVRKRQQERRLADAPRGADGTIVEALLESDPAPARLLVELLREDRDRWHVEFAAAWSDEIAFVLSRIANRDERELWRVTFESTRSVWQANWSNAPGPGRQLSHELADEPDESTDERVTALLVA
jgi:hypothetical protein